MIAFLEDAYARSQRRGPGAALVMLTIGTATTAALLFCAVMVVILLVQLANLYAPIDLGLLPTRAW